jgi:peptidoglycan/xylan/chitin deacetylase (PgdA/CDA1 family)
MDYPFVPSQMRVSPAHFEAQMAYLVRHCHIVGLTELGAAIRTGSCLPFRTVALTFDDGFKDNLTYVLPVLRRYGLVATFFVVSGWIGKERLSWLHRLYYMIWQGPVPALISDFSRELQSRGYKTVESRIIETPDLISGLRWLLLNQVETSDREDVIEAIWQRRAGLSKGEEQKMAGGLYLSWDDLNEIVNSGMEVGSHTQSHPQLSGLRVPQMEKEIVGGKRMLEERLQRPVLAFSYPFGDAASFHGECQKVLQQIGIRTACTRVDHVGSPGRDLISLCRRPVVDMSLSEFALEMTGLPGILRRARLRLRRVCGGKCEDLPDH